MTRGEEYFRAMQKLSPKAFGPHRWEDQPDPEVWEAYADPESFGRNPKPKLIRDENRKLYGQWRKP